MASKARTTDERLASAVRDLLRAELDFTRLYGAWTLADAKQRPTLRSALERAERRVDDAEREVIRKQSE